MNLIPITSPNIANDEFVRSNELALLVCEQVFSLYERTQPESPWLAYLLENESVIVGSCAFKSSPVAGRVEIAYFTFPEFEGRGFASEMVSRLLATAAETDSTIQVYAQTLPSISASTKILGKKGFICSGTVNHPEDGLVWEWIKV